MVSKQKPEGEVVAACGKGKRRGVNLANRPVLEAHAAGVDIGATELFVAVPPETDPEPVRKFQSFTADLKQLVDWLEACGVTTVAMESTGVYWTPLYELLEQRGLKPRVVDARHMKNVPGRRPDWHECQWIQFLHSAGLLRAAYRPELDVCAARTLMRHRTDLVGMANQHGQHMHKALTQMNLQIHQVIDDITGLTGLRIVDAILAGERDAAVLAGLRDHRVKASAETVRKSLEGNWRLEHLFTLRQSLEIYRNYRKQIEACDAQIEKLLVRFQPRVEPEPRPLPADRKQGQRRNKSKTTNPQTGFDIRTESYKLFGMDLTQVPGLSKNILTLFTEVGRDMSAWPTAAHFVSWQALCPDHDISGGKVLWRGLRKTNHRVAQIFRMAAQGMHHDRTPMGDYFRRMRAKLGPKGAITATARKIATIFYTLVKNQVEYDITLWAQADEEREQRIATRLKRQAEARAFRLVPIEQPV